MDASFVRALTRSAVLSSVALAIVAAFLACGETSTSPETDAAAPDGVAPDGVAPGEGGVDAPADAPAPPLDGGRAVAVACTPRVRGAGNLGEAGAAFAPDASNACATDSECDGGLEGRCDAPVCSGSAINESFGARCAYDACSADDDCGGVAVCGCGLGVNGRNVCLTLGNCRTNGDCAASQICALSVPCTAKVGDRVCSYCNVPIVSGEESGEAIPNAEGSVGYFCTTANDECRPGDRPDGGRWGLCMFSPSAGRWGFDYGP